MGNTLIKVSRIHVAAREDHSTFACNLALIPLAFIILPAHQIVGLEVQLAMSVWPLVDDATKILANVELNGLPIIILIVIAFV